MGRLSQKKKQHLAAATGRRKLLYNSRRGCCNKVTAYFLNIFFIIYTVHSSLVNSSGGQGSELYYIVAFANNLKQNKTDSKIDSSKIVTSMLLV